MGNLLRGIIYTGIAGATGIAGYMIGKYKHMRGVSLTMVGLALVLYAPKGCDVMETYLKTHSEVEKAKIYGTFKKDSLDAIVQNKQLKDSTSHLKNFLQNTLDSRKKLEETYKDMLSRNETEYKRLLKKNDEGYTSALNVLREQSGILQKNTANLVSTQDSIQIKPYKNSLTASNKNIVDKNTINAVNSDVMIPEGTLSILETYIAGGDYGRTMSSKDLADGTRVDIVTFHDGKTLSFRYPVGPYVMTTSNTRGK